MREGYYRKTGMGTLPSPILFIHISGAGTAFIAIGRSYYDVKGSIRELEFLFYAQRKNGMLPHIVFSENVTVYFPPLLNSMMHRDPRSTIGVDHYC